MNRTISVGEESILPLQKSSKTNYPGTLEKDLDLAASIVPAYASADVGRSAQAGKFPAGLLKATMKSTYRFSGGVEYCDR